MIQKRFVLNDPVSNHNKEWQIEYNPATRQMTTRWGRVGTKLSSATKSISSSAVDNLIAEKETKGYREIGVAASQSGIQVHPVHEIAFLLELVQVEAGLASQKTLLDVNSLSRQQIEAGLTLLASDDYLTYYNTIPTVLPRKLSPQILKEIFDQSKIEYEDNLRNALVGLNNTPTTNPLSIFKKTEISLAKPSPHWDQLKRTLPYGAKVRYSYDIYIEAEREAYQKNSIGRSDIKTLFHGSSSRNARYILDGGLIIPKSQGYASRFGMGIYLADYADKSYNYCTYNSKPYKLIFLIEAAIGNHKVYSDGPYKFTQAPNGYDSVKGIKSYGGRDEYCIYNPSQQTIVGLAVIEG